MCICVVTLGNPNFEIPRTVLIDQGPSKLNLFIRQGMIQGFSRGGPAVMQ